MEDKSLLEHMMAEFSSDLLGIILKLDAAHLAASGASRPNAAEREAAATERRYQNAVRYLSKVDEDGCTAEERVDAATEAPTAAG
jgi:hypothetical protein